MGMVHEGSSPILVHLFTDSLLMFRKGTLFDTISTHLKPSRTATVLHNLIPRVLSYSGRVGENPGNEVEFYTFFGTIHKYFEASFTLRTIQNLVVKFGCEDYGMAIPLKGQK